ncbi:heme biosynthesis protein HemY [Massilia sp. TS11]|nr:heme biosynthesis protein HemY [Massilia sp. TS11]
MGLAVGVAVTMYSNPGNVIFVYQGNRVDMSLNLFVMLEAAGFLALYILIRAIRNTMKMPARVAAYRQAKRERDSNKGLRDALKALFEGRFGHAEKAAARAAELPENAGVAALIGARAAHRMRQHARRDGWLASVAHDKALSTARLMTTTELLIDEHQPEQALAAVAELNASGTRHIHALQLSMKAHQQTKNWPEVLRLVRMLDKHKALHPALSARLRELSYQSLLDDASHDAQAIARVWSTIPTADRVKPYVAARAVQALAARGLFDEARLAAEEALAAEWDERVVSAYRECAAPAGSPSLLAQIEKCEQWIKERPTDAELALTIGALCLRQKLWGKAQQYLEQALSDASSADMVRDTHLKLAQLHEALNHPDEAAQHYRQSALAQLI